MAWNISKTKRQALVKLQLRDKDGKFIEMGGGVKWYSSRLKKVVAGTVVGSKGENALVRLNKENPTHEPALVSVPAASIQAIDGKASLSPKGEPTADETPEFDEPEAVADVEADPNAEADSDHESQLKGPQHLAANYGITETSDGNTYITRNDDASIYSSGRELKVGDELIAPAGADPTKPFSIGRGWATKGTERLNKEGEGPVIGKVIAISENRYAVVQMAGGHTIADRRNPEEQTDTVTVGLSNQVILATMGLKEALGDRVSSQTYAERPSDEEKEVAPDAPEAQSDHEGREVPEDQLEDEPATEETDPAARTEQQLEIARSLPVGGFVVADDGSQKFTKTATNQWQFSGGEQLIDDAAMVRMVQRGEGEGKKYKAGTEDDGSAAPESAPEATEAPEAQPAPEAPAEESPEAVEEAPEADAPAKEAPETSEAPEEAPQAKATPVNDIVDGLAELEQAAEDIEDSGLEDEEAEEVLNGASFGVVGNDGAKLNVTAEKDENGDWNFVVADENGAEVASHIIGSEENRVLAEKIAKGSAPVKTEEAPAAEATPEAAPEATPEYNENGLTEQEERELASYTRLAARSYDQFKDAEGDRYKAMADELLAKAEARKSSAPAEAPVIGPTDAEKIANAEKMYGTGSPQHLEAQRRFGQPSAPAQEAEKAPESAPEPEKAPEVTPEPEKPVEDAPAPSLVEPDVAPEEAEKPLLNGEEGFVPIDGRGMEGKQNTTPTVAPSAKPVPFGVSFERRADGLDHPVASDPEAMTDEENAEFARQDIALTYAQHENRRGAEATARRKLAELERRVQTRIDSESMKRQRDIQNGDSLEEAAPESNTPEAPAVEEVPEAPAAEAPEVAPVVNPEANEDGLLPDEAARLADLENRQAAAFRGETDEDPASFDGEISELIRHGRLRGRGREVGPFVARNPAPDAAPAQDTPEPDAPEAPTAEAPAAPEAPRTRRARGEVVPVADADGNMITIGDKIGHPTLGPVEITNTIPGSGRVEFIDPTTGRKKSVKAARVRKIDPDADTATTEQPMTAEPGERFVDAATGKQGFGDKNGNRVLVGDRVTDANGNEGTVISVYTAASGGAWIPVKWDSDGKTRRVMGAQLAKGDDTTAPEATPAAPEEPFEVARPSATPAPSPEPAAPEAPADEPFEPVIPSATPATETPSTVVPDRTASLSELNPGSSVSAGSGAIFTKGDNGMWTMEGNPIEYSDANLAELSTLGEGKLELITAAPKRVPSASTEETYEQQLARTEKLAADTPINGAIVSSDGTQKFYKISETQFQFNEGSLLGPISVARMVRLGESRGMRFGIAEAERPAEVNTPATDVPAVDSALPPGFAPEHTERNIRKLRELPVGTKISPRSGEYTFTKNGSDDWSSTVDDGVYDTADVYNVIRSGRENGLIYRIDRPASTSAEPTVLPTVTLADIPLEADSLVPPTVASRLEAFRRAPVGTTVTSPAGTTTYTKQGDDNWTNPDIVGATIKNSTLAVATDSDDGHWVFNKTGPAEPEGTNITAMSAMDALRAFRQAPLGSKLISTGGKVITKVEDRLWRSDNGTDYQPSDLVFVTRPAQSDVTGPFGLVLPEVAAPANELPSDRIERSQAIAALPTGTVITIGEYIFTKLGENNWEPTGYANEPHTDMDVAYAGSSSTPGTFVVPAPKPIPQDLANRVRVSEEAPIGTVVTSSMGESYTKISDTQWADTATGNFKYGLGEFASKLQNNIYTGDYFVQGFDVPDINAVAPDASFAGGTLSEDQDEMARQIKSLPDGSTVTGGRNNTTFVRRGADLWSPENAPEEYYNDEDLAWRMTLARTTNAPVAALPDTGPAVEASEVPRGPAIHAGLAKGSFVPSAAGSKSGVKKVDDDKWEMIKDGQPTGRFVNDEAATIIQELVGTEVYDPRFGENIGMYAEDLKLPGGKSLGEYLESGGSYGRLTEVQKNAIRAGYKRFIDNLNTKLPDGFRAELDGLTFGSNSMETSVQFYDKNGRAVNPASRRFSTSVDDRTGRQVSSVDHAYWHLADDAQGSGLSAAFLAASKQMYRQMGLDRITVHADISVGSYAWARGGFDFVSRHHVGVAMRAWEGSWGQAPRGREQEWRDGIAEFNRLKALATPAAFMNKTHPPAVLFANIGRPTDPAKTGPNDTWFGKAMLSNTHWWGAFNLNPNG